MSDRRNTNATGHSLHHPNPQRTTNPMWNSSHQRSELRQPAASRPNPELSRLFNTPATRPLHLDDESVVILREVSYAKPANQVRTVGNQSLPGEQKQAHNSQGQGRNCNSTVPTLIGQRPKNTIQAAAAPSTVQSSVPGSFPQRKQSSTGAKSPSMLSSIPNSLCQPLKTPVQNRSPSDHSSASVRRPSPSQTQAAQSSAHQVLSHSFGSQQTSTQQAASVQNAQQALQAISHGPQNIYASRSGQTTLPKSHNHQNALYQSTASINRVHGTTSSRMSPQPQNNGGLNNATTSSVPAQPRNHHESQRRIAQKYQDKPGPNLSKNRVPVQNQNLQSQQVQNTSQQLQNIRGSTPNTSCNNKRTAESDKCTSQPPAKKRVQLQTAPVAINGVATTTSSNSHKVSAPARSPATQSSPSHLATAAEVIATLRKQQKEQLQKPPPAVAHTSKEMLDVLSYKGPSLASSSKTLARSDDRASHSITSPTPSTPNEPDIIEVELKGALDEAANAIRRQLAGRVRKNFSHKLDSARKALLTFAADVPADRSGLKAILRLLEFFDKPNYEEGIEKANAKIQKDRKEKENQKKTNDTVKRLQKLEEALTKMREQFPDNEENWTLDQKKSYKPVASEFNELYKEYVNLTGDGCEVRNEAHKNLLRPVHLTEASNYTEINLAVQDYVNASKEEFKHSLALSVEEIHTPCFKDIKEIVENVAAEISLMISREAQDRLARSLYNAILLHNQVGRSQDNLMSIYQQARISDDHSRREAFRADPALRSPELEQTLRKNSVIAEASMEAVIDMYAHMSEIRSERDDDADSIRTEVLNPDDESSYDLEDLIAGLTGPDIDDSQVAVTTDQDLSMFDNEDAQLPQERPTCTGSRTQEEYQRTRISFEFEQDQAGEENTGQQFPFLKGWHE